MRIGIAFFYHESHTFSPIQTDLEDFQKEGYYIGNKILEVYEGTKTEVGGFIDLIRQKQGTIVPLVCAAAIPSGTVTRDAYDLIKKDLLHAIRQAGKLDGLLLALHGAMVVTGISDPEAEILREIRAILGADVPIATTLDMHANLSERMLDHTPFHFGFKTYPHVDMYQQGCKAGEILMRYLEKKESYYASFVKLPLLLPSINMRTAEGPMHDLVESTRNLETDPNITAASVFGGFPYVDIPETGASVLVVGTDQQKVENVAQVLAKKVWDYRNHFLIDLPSVTDGLEMALSLQTDKPVVVADVSDNPLSGGTGDTTLLLQEMLAMNLQNALFGALYDEESLHICREAGIGAKVSLHLGGKLAPEYGPPIPVKATIIKLSDGKFRNKGPMNTGLLVNTNGAAHIRVGELDILLTGRALSANDPELFRHIGIEPSDKKILGLKVKNHFRAAFDPLVSQIINVDAPGLASNKLTHFDFQHIPRPIWPLDEIEFTQISSTTSC